MYVFGKARVKLMLTVVYNADKDIVIDKNFFRGLSKRAKPSGKHEKCSGIVNYGFFLKYRSVKAFQFVFYFYARGR